MAWPDSLGSGWGEGLLSVSYIYIGNVHSAHNWREVLGPIVARYGRTGVRRYFRADAAFAKP